ncbi:V-type proton ATPase 116 kDa subunit a [Drosophila obscura]|uniref:V-type proton ATPase 116 kDa subunit a n=1 Tax=Drosophila obscura TaxID=7282 RepID=UPI001BB212FC|nr:V-type proton ATPase 116 kDa subunit a [Drosophila obscura]
MAKAFFRSEEMELCQLLLHTENAFDCVMELGHHGGLQFNNVYDEDRQMNGMYTKKVTLCSELLRIADNLQHQMAELQIKVYFYPDVDWENRLIERDLKEYGERLRRLHVETTAVMEHYNALDRRRYWMLEHRFAIGKADKFFASDMGSELLYSESTLLTLIKDAAEDSPAHRQLNYIIGSIRADKFESFELLCYRLFGFNLVVRFAEMPMPMMDFHGHRSEKVRKFSLLLLTNSTMIWPKVNKLCHAYHVTIYECPESTTLRMAKVQELSEEIENLERILYESQRIRVQILEVTARDLYLVRVNLTKAVRVYDLLNRLRPVGGLERQKYLQAECFVPVSDLEGVRTALKKGTRIKAGADKPEQQQQQEEENQQQEQDQQQEELVSDADNEPSMLGPARQSTDEQSLPPLLLKKNRHSSHIPPTFFRLNKFTQGFQNLIDSYGISDYREINPAPYTIITFPFLFSVMFGDFGHGILVTLFALLLIWKEKSIAAGQRAAKEENEILNILFAGRYIVLLMGLFSIYMGLIYNDALSKSLNIFGSSWSCRYNASTLDHMTGQLNLDPSNRYFYSGNPYPFGVDPVWKVCGEDSITTFNSLKMKLAIILGIAQMMFGLSLSAVNCVILKRKADLLLVVVPQFVFMICLFCYLVFLIFLKWLLYGGLKSTPFNSACAPSVLITFIDMMLMKNTELDDVQCNSEMFKGERLLEYILVFVAFLAVPVLLAGKPIYLQRRQKKLKKQRQERDIQELKQNGREILKEMRSAQRYSIDSQEDTVNEKRDSKPKAHSADHAEEFDLSEIWIHSGIHTIETVLGSVSHTASYLRLWALSLAHDQLSHVLWHMVLAKGLKTDAPIYMAVPMLAFSFLAWSVLTVAILVGMEGLSAFLHTLRLHWVEFQSKFYSGSGEPFRPFKFAPSSQRT